MLRGKNECDIELGVTFGFVPWIVIVSLLIALLLFCFSLSLSQVYAGLPRVTKMLVNRDDFEEHLLFE